MRKQNFSFKALLMVAVLSFAGIFSANATAYYGRHMQNDEIRAMKVGESKTIVMANSCHTSNYFLGWDGTQALGGITFTDDGLVVGGVCFAYKTSNQDQAANNAAYKFKLTREADGFTLLASDGVTYLGYEGNKVVWSETPSYWSVAELEANDLGNVVPTDGAQYVHKAADLTRFVGGENFLNSQNSPAALSMKPGTGGWSYWMVYEVDFYLDPTGDVTVESPWQGDYVIPGGIYYLYNPAGKGFVAGGNSWGTRAVFAADAYPVTVEKVDGGFTLKTVTNQWIGENLFVDVTPGGVFELEQVGKYVYTIKHGENYIGYTTNNEVNDTKDVNAGCYWQFITKPRLIAQLKDATPEAPMSATALIGMSNFSRVNQTFDKYWTKDRMNGNGGALGGDDTNNCYEIWNSDAAGFDFNQTINYLPAGTYRISAQGFYRQGSPAEDCDAYQNGTLIDIPVKLYANGASKAVLSERAELSAIDEGTSTALGKYADSMTQASHYFSAGCYWNSVYVEIAENEPLKFGFVKDGGVPYDWFICDNFQLTYYGNVKIAAELQAADDLAAAKAQLTKDIAALESTVAKAKSALALASDGDIEALKAAIQAGDAALAAAKTTLAGATKAAQAEEASAKAVEAAKAIEAAKANVTFIPTVESPWLGEAFDAEAIAMLYNPNAGQFFGSAATTSPWATQASTDAVPVNFTLVAAEEEGFYKFICTLYPERTIGWDASADPQFFNDITTQAVTTYKFEQVETSDPKQTVYSIYVKSAKSDGSAAIEGYLYADGPASKISVKETLDETGFWQFFDQTAKLDLKAAIEAAGANAYEAIALQTTDASAAGYLWSNAPDQAEGQHPEYMLDGDPNTFFHSDWHGVVSDPHYLEIDMGEGQSISEFAIKYQRRMSNNADRATEIIIEGSNDGETYTAIRTLTQAADGLPTVQGDDTYTSPIINAGTGYRYVRFTVSKTSSNKIFFTFSEFGLVSKSANYDAVLAAVAAAQGVYDDPNATKTDYVTAKARLEAAIEGKLADGTYYFYNAESGKFLSRGAAWGTQACLGDYGLPFTISTNAESISNLKSLDWQNRGLGLINGTDGGAYVDATGEFDYNYEVVDGGYIFKNVLDGYMAVVDNANTKALFGLGTHATKEDALVFQALTASEYEAVIAARFEAETNAAAKAAGIDDAQNVIDNWYLIDVTDKVQSAALINGYSGWNWASGLYRGGSLASDGNGTECYQGTGVLSQTVSGLMPGFYKASIQGYVRIDGQRAGNIDWFNQGYLMSTTYFEANGNKTRIQPIGAEADLNGSSIYPNWMSEGAACFAEGRYVNEVYAYVGTDGTLKLSVNLPTWKDECWVMLQNVKVYRFSAEPEAINGEEGTTGIQNASVEAADAPVYDLFGRKVSDLQKGVIYIQNGEKIMK